MLLRGWLDSFYFAPTGTAAETADDDGGITDDEVFAAGVETGWPKHLMSSRLREFGEIAPMPEEIYVLELTLDELGALVDLGDSGDELESSIYTKACTKLRKVRDAEPRTEF